MVLSVKNRKDKKPGIGVPLTGEIMGREWQAKGLSDSSGGGKKGGG